MTDLDRPQVERTRTPRVALDEPDTAGPGDVTLAPDSPDAFLLRFARAGYVRCEPPVLQPADVFLDLSGEDIRRRLFVTQDGGGRELCLRPEYTIPVCRHYLASPLRGQAAAFSYLGPVFRLHAGETGEFPQVGIESFGRDDREAADAEVLSLALDAVGALGLATPVIRLGDMAVLNALVDALKIDAATKRRLLRRIARGKRLVAAAVPANGSGEGADEYAGLLAAIEGQDAKAARAFVEDLLAIAGISRVGGRGPGEIAERFLAGASRRSGSLSAETRAVLDRYLAIRGDPDAVLLALRELAAQASLDLACVLDAFERRTGFMAARGIDVERLVFAAAFVRNLDYYTGFIFDMHAGEADTRPVGGGGRYDGLLGRLGAAAPIAAVGCAIALDRFGRPRGGEPAEPAPGATR